MPPMSVFSLVLTLLPQMMPKCVSPTVQATPTINLQIIVPILVSIYVQPLLITMLITMSAFSLVQLVNLQIHLLESELALLYARLGYSVILFQVAVCLHVL